MATRVSVNGFGRIGRLVARAILENPGSGLELVSINDLADAESNALLFKRDSVHGAWPGDVRADGNDLVVDGHRIRVHAERDPANLPHREEGIEIVLECSGFFTDRDKASAHLTAGAKKVLISAPAKGVDLTVVYGVNDDKLEAGHTIVSNASCTTNCLAPVAKVMNEAIGVERGLMTTIHSYTNDQKILDQIHPDAPRPRRRHVDDPDHHRRRPRGRRGACLNSRALDGAAIRVPRVSLIDLTFTWPRHPVEEVTRCSRPPPGADEGDSLIRRAIGLDRLQSQSGSSTVDSLETRCSRASSCGCFPGTTMNGLFEPDGRHRRRDGPPDLTSWRRSLPSTTSATPAASGCWSARI